jgi:protein-S-isoprenylcysteine O-methyltransferase Ste14
MSSWTSNPAAPLHAQHEANPLAAASAHVHALGGAPALSPRPARSLWSSIAGYILLMLISAALTAAFVSWRMELKSASASPASPAAADAAQPSPSPAAEISPHTR